MTQRSRLLAAGLVLALSCAAAASAQSVAGDRERQRNEGKDGKPATTDEWSRDLANEDPLVRLKGVKMLSESTDAKAVPFLVQALGDPDLRVRAKAIDACATVRANDATPVMRSSNSSLAILKMSPSGGQVTRRRGAAARSRRRR